MINKRNYDKTIVIPQPIVNLVKGVTKVSRCKQNWFVPTLNIDWNDHPSKSMIERHVFFFFLFFQKPQCMMPSRRERQNEERIFRLEETCEKMTTVNDAVISKKNENLRGEVGRIKEVHKVTAIFLQRTPNEALTQASNEKAFGVRRQKKIGQSTRFTSLHCLLSGSLASFLCRRLDWCWVVCRWHGSVAGHCGISSAFLLSCTAVLGRNIHWSSLCRIFFFWVDHLWSPNCRWRAWSQAPFCHVHWATVQKRANDHRHVIAALSINTTLWR